MTYDVIRAFEHYKRLFRYLFRYLIQIHLEQLYSLWPVAIYNNIKETRY